MNNSEHYRCAHGCDVRLLHERSLQATIRPCASTECKEKEGCSRHDITRSHHESMAMESLYLWLAGRRIFVAVLAIRVAVIISLASSGACCTWFRIGSLPEIIHSSLQQPDHAAISDVI